MLVAITRVQRVTGAFLHKSVIRSSVTEINLVNNNKVLCVLAIPIVRICLQFSNTVY